MSWLWERIALPTIGAFIEWVPWWAWLLLLALALGFGWKWAHKFYQVFGWQGVLTVGIALLTLGAYRQGWLDHKTTTLSGIPKSDPLFDLSPKTRNIVKKPRGKRVYNPDTNEWE